MKIRKICFLVHVFLWFLLIFQVRVAETAEIPFERIGISLDKIEKKDSDSLLDRIEQGGLDGLNPLLLPLVKESLEKTVKDNYSVPVLKTFLRFGFLEELMDLLPNERVQDERLAYLKVQALLFFPSMEKEACKLASNVWSENPRWTKLVAFCRYLEGDFPRTEFLLSLIDKSEKIFLPLMESLLAGDAVKWEELDGKLDTIDLAVIRKAGWKLPNRLVSTVLAKRFVASSVQYEESFRLKHLWWSYKAGFVTKAKLRAVYENLRFSAEQVRDYPAQKLDEEEMAGLLYQVFLAQKDAETALSVLKYALEWAKSSEVYFLVASLFELEMGAFAPSRAMSDYAQHFVSVFLSQGDFGKAKSWMKVMMGQKTPNLWLVMQFDAIGVIAGTKPLFKHLFVQEKFPPELYKTLMALGQEVSLANQDFTEQLGEIPLEIWWKRKHSELWTLLFLSQCQSLTNSICLDAMSGLKQEVVRRVLVWHHLGKLP